MIVRCDKRKECSGAVECNFNYGVDLDHVDAIRSIDGIRMVAQAQGAPCGYMVYFRMEEANE